MKAGAAEAHKFSKETIERGADHIQKEAKALGKTISREDAVAQAQAMLFGTNDGGELPEMFV